MAQSEVIRFRGFCSLLRHINSGRSVGRSQNRSSLQLLSYTVKLFGYLILISIDLYDFFVYSIVLVSIGKIYQTLKTVFDHISKHLEVRQKRSAARLGVWKCGQTRPFVFDVLLQGLHSCHF